MAINVVPAVAIALGVSYVDAGFDASWREITVEAAVTNPDVLQVDVVDPIEQISKELIKARTDAFSVVQGTTTIGFDKSSSDDFSYGDATTLVLAKLLVDTQGFTDETAFDVSKALADTPIISEQEAKDFTKAVADATTVTTAQVTKELQKVFADSVTMLDLATRIKTFVRDFADDTVLLDLYASQFETPEADSASVADQSTLAVALSKQESLLLLDNMDGDLTYAFCKSIGLAITPNDQTALSPSLAKSDVGTLVSSGVLTIQDYCDITYFAEDYVGESRTFS